MEKYSQEQISLLSEIPRLSRSQGVTGLAAVFPRRFGRAYLNVA
jgi:hypothetical protein